MTLNRPRGLYLALMWRYILVTTSALLVVELLALLVLTRLAPPYTFGMQPDVYLIRDLAETARDYLLTDDLDGLDRWLQELRQPVLNVSLSDHWMRLNLDTFPLREQHTVLVFAEHDGVLAITPHDSVFRTVQRIEDLPGPLGSELLHAVPPRPGNNIVTTRNGSQMMSVFPIQQDDGTLLALFIVLNLAAEHPPSPGDVLVLAGVSTLLLLAVTAALGGGFGILASRFLVRRLRDLVQTTATWGVGDFSHPVHGVQQDDEIAALARHLNQLRTRIQDLLVMRAQMIVLEERSRFAQELHDSVKQQVFTLRMNLATLDYLLPRPHDQIEPLLSKTAALAQHIQDELTLMIQMFRNELAPVAPFPQRLATLVADWSTQTGIPVAFDLQCEDIADLRLGHTVYRLVQEALTNIYKHSAASAVTLHLHQADRVLCIQIADNGTGFDPAQVVPGIGLVSMRERVEALGGTLTITSNQQGTTIQAQIPREEGNNATDFGPGCG